MTAKETGSFKGANAGLLMSNKRAIGKFPITKISTHKSNHQWEFTPVFSSTTSK